MRQHTTIRPLRHTAALLCAALTVFGLAGRVSAQVTGPLPSPYTSPPQPTPYQWQNYHSGGAPIPAAQYPFPPSANAALGLTPLIDPLQSQLQGTPTELYNGVLTEIPSFLLGDYDPTRPPGGIGGTDPVNGGAIDTYFPNHFADDNTPSGIFQWAAPFDYVSQTSGQVTVDDGPLPSTPPVYNNAGVATASGFTITPASNAWESVTPPGAATAGNFISPAAGNATNAEYLRLPTGTAGSAVWTLVEPAAGNYSLYLHIPSDLPDVNNNAEARSTQVVYFIRVLDAAGNVTTSQTATASQTEANDSQFLAGPFAVAAGGSVVVTLTRSNTVNNGSTYLVADSVALQATIGDVQSAPTVITRTSYPDDFARAQYWGILPGSASVQAAAGAAAAQNAPPDTNDGTTTATSTILLKSGNPATSVGTTGAYDPTRLIRQLVYVGRSDPSASVTATLDDSNNGFSGGGTIVSNEPTASNGEYRAFSTAASQTLGSAAATWTVPVPAAAAGSDFFVYAHIPATPTGQTRLPRVYYTVTVNGTLLPAVSISQVTQGTDALVALPTGALQPAVGSTITVQMYAENTTGTANSPVVVADSVNVSTGTGQGAIYCVDGFTGGVVWRFQTPGSANGASAPVFASPAIARINVYTPATSTTPAGYQNRLVVIVGDNNGLVYCLDAIGSGDGTSNAAVLNAATGQPNTIPQPAYGTPAAPLAAGTTYAAASAAAHVGTTPVYWIYRPDATQPKYVTGTSAGAVKPIDPTVDLPVPAAFSTASPVIFVDPTVNTGVATTANPNPAAPTGTNSIVYIGSSNGVLYALDGAGAPIDGTNSTTYAATGDKFNVSQIGGTFDVPTINANTSDPFPLTAVVPTTTPRWWFSLRGVDPNSGTNASSADIESAPALYVTTVTVTPAPPATPTTTYLPTVYIGSAHEMEATSNVGRLYALNGLYGPAGDNGQLDPSKQPNPASASYTGPGSFNYNVGQRPALNAGDKTDWTFPDAYGSYTTPSGTVAGLSSSGQARPALGNITGSPVVFSNVLDETVNPTRIYIAANSGFEATAAVPVPTARPDDTATGRVWAVNLNGTVGSTTGGTIGNNTTTPANGVWSYPLAFDPNDATKDGQAQPYAPIGAFLRATPAIGYVQFPSTIINGDGTTYNPSDAFHAGIAGQPVPMLYVATRGVNDTSLYAVDIDGSMITPADTGATLTSSDTSPNDSRTIYRIISPDGSIFQSSVALVTNATSAGGNGGAIYAVAGNTLYDYTATPISSSFSGTPSPLVRENAALSSFGPISSPAVVGADITDVIPTGSTTGGPIGAPYTTDTTDWVIVGDSASGFCRGITPNDPADPAIPIGFLNSVVPPAVNPAVQSLLNAIIQAFLVPSLTNVSSSKAQPVGANATLSVYDWGESVYACFTNVAPPNPVNPATGAPDPTRFVYDHTLYPNGPVAGSTPFYTSDGTTAQTVTFNLSDADTTTTNPLLQDNGSINPVVLSNSAVQATGAALNGFVVDTGLLTSATPPYSQAVSNVVQNLQTTSNTRYLGTYAYVIADGSARNNTPGARRRFLNVKQNVTEYLYNGGDVTSIGSYTKTGTAILTGDATNNNLVTVRTGAAGTPGFEGVPAIDQPTFGILNPLAARGGGVPLLGGGGLTVPIGDEAGPFRSVNTSTANGGLPLPTATTYTTANPGDVLGMQALTNGNDVLAYAPPSTSGVGASPILLPNASNDPAGVTAPTTTNVVVTTTGEIVHNTTGTNVGNDPAGSLAPQGTYNSSGDGLATTAFGGAGLDVFDRGALFNLSQKLRFKMTVPTNTLFAPPSGRDGMYWNSNVGGSNPNPDITGHDAVVNFLPWEIPPTSYQVGGQANGSQDYPDIAPGSITQTALPLSGGTGGNLATGSVLLPPGKAGTATNGSDPIKSRTVFGEPVQIQVAVPNHQPANQQLYQQQVNIPYTQTMIPHYGTAGQIAPVTLNTNGVVTNYNISTNYSSTPSPSGVGVFPMGYVTSKRLYVPNANGFYSAQRPYRDVRIYTGVPVDMRTSIANATVDIGKAPAAFGVQTENYGPGGINSNLFDPYNPYFQPYFKPLEIHNDGNVNLLNVHLDQKAAVAANGNLQPTTLQLYSDANDPLSFLDGYDLSDITGPRTGTLTTQTGTTITEEPFLIRSSLDTDLVAAAGRNPYIVNGYSATYPSATFHKPVPGSDQPSTLMVPDAPERFIPGASPGSANFQGSPTGFPIMPANGVVFQASPYVSLAFPFGTPIGTYHTAAAQSNASLRLFEGLDAPTTANNGDVYSLNLTNPASYLYPPQYSGAVGGIGAPNAALTDVYTSAEPASTIGTQLIGTVVEQRMTDGATYGTVPMLENKPAGTNSQGAFDNLSTPDFAPAAFRDPVSGQISLYWTSGRFGPGAYAVYGMEAPYNVSSSGKPGNYFYPNDTTNDWWYSLGGYTGVASLSPLAPVLPEAGLPQGASSGLSVAVDPLTSSAAPSVYAFAVTVSSTAPYSNTLYSYTVTPKTGGLTSYLPITPPSMSSQVKYGVKGLSTVGTGFANNLWAFWTASTRGRTALYYNSLGANGAWIPAGTAASTVGLLPVPAGLTAVADASPLLMPYAPITGGLGPVMEVTYSGTAPDGSIDLYTSRYRPHVSANAQDPEPASHLDLVAFPPVTENLKTAPGGWYQSRDVAWSRTGALNVSVSYRDNQGNIQTLPSLLYQGTNNTPQFTNAIYDKTSGLLVLTGVKVPIIPVSGVVTAYTTNTVYVDAATGRIRFSPALLPATQNFTRIQATFSPQARRLTTDSLADTAPVTFLDDTPKSNDAALVTGATAQATATVSASRRWTIWRKAGTAGTSSPPSLYFKTQRLTFFVPTAIDPTKTVGITLNGTSYTNPVDIDYLRGRLYFPMLSGAEGATAVVTYTDTNGKAHDGTAFPAVTDAVQWQDEPQVNNADVPPADSAAGLDQVLDSLVPLDLKTNENNVAAFLDPYASATSPHKVWLFWNSTRNGTADIYSATIDPRFAPAPTTQ